MKSAAAGSYCFSSMSCMARLKRPPSLNFCSVAWRAGFRATSADCRRAEASSTAFQSFMARYDSMIRLAANCATSLAGQRPTTSSKRQRASSKSLYR